MTPERERLVRETLPMLERASHEASRDFYDHLFALDPSTRAMFAGVDMAQQGAKFVAMLASIIRVIDQAPRLVSDVASLGRRHAHLNARPEHFESVRVALIWAIERTLGPACTDEVREAWTEAYSLIAAVMQRATAAHDARASQEPRSTSEGAPLLAGEATRGVQPRHPAHSLP